MSAQAIFYRKNFVDLSRTDVTITVTDATATNTGQAYIDFVRNRNNRSSWLTTGSNDAANTQLDIEFADEKDITDIILVEHNFDSFTIQYWNGSSYVDFSTPINQSGVTDTTSNFEFTKVSTSRVRIIITGTQTPNAEKRLAQLYIVQKIGQGQLEAFPQIDPVHNTNKRVNRLLSGKVNLVESVGALRIRLSVANWKIANDISIIEDIYFSRQGFHVYLSGGDEAQFAVPTIGYRKQDIYFVRAVNDYNPIFTRNYQTGYNLTIDLEEAIG